MYTVTVHKPEINPFEYSSEYSCFASPHNLPNQELFPSNNGQKAPFKCCLNLEVQWRYSGKQRSFVCQNYTFWLSFLYFSEALHMFNIYLLTSNCISLGASQVHSNPLEMKSLCFKEMKTQIFENHRKLCALCSFLANRKPKHQPPYTESVSAANSRCCWKSSPRGE